LYVIKNIENVNLKSTKILEIFSLDMM